MHWPTIVTALAGGAAANSAATTTGALAALRHEQQPAIVSILTNPRSVQQVVMVNNATDNSVDAVAVDSAVPIRGWSVDATACRDLIAVHGAKLAMPLSIPTCVCVDAANKDETPVASNDNSTQSEQVTAAGAIPRQVQSSMAGLLGFFIIGLIIL
jgi:hypothetical protein